MKLTMNDSNSNSCSESSDNLIKLQAFISAAANLSRRAAAAKIEEGCVTVNDKQIIAPFFRVAKADIVKLNGKRLQIKVSAREVWMLNKPASYICTNSDPQNRPLAISLIPSKERLFTVGRLDYNSCGLILATNDGDLANKIMHPSNEVVKQYEVSTTTPIDEKILKKFQKGFYINRIKYTIERYKIVNNYLVNLWLKEGKNREIRRLFESQSLKIKKLQRVAIGNLKLNNLPSGQARLLSQKELDLIFQMNLQEV